MVQHIINTCKAVAVLKVISQLAKEKANLVNYAKGRR